VMTQWQIFTEFSRKFPENLTLLLVQMLSCQYLPLRIRRDRYMG